MGNTRAGSSPAFGTIQPFQGAISIGCALSFLGPFRTGCGKWPVQSAYSLLVAARDEAAMDVHSDLDVGEYRNYSFTYGRLAASLNSRLA